MKFQEIPFAELAQLRRLYRHLVVVYIMRDCPFCPRMLDRLSRVLANTTNKGTLPQIYVVCYDDAKEAVLSVAKVSRFPTIQKFARGGDPQEFDIRNDDAALTDFLCNVEGGSAIARSAITR